MDSKKNDYKINDLINKSEDELYELIGKELDDSFISEGAEQLILRGKVWLKKNEKNLAKIICTKSIYLFTKNENMEIPILALYLKEIIEASTDIKIAVPTSIVSLIVVKQGLNKLCKTTWSDL
ncbi:hypothetical protein Q4Q35_13880 [Flavivirga aquimarina]|uniref:Uncharacterized protein n=1 Tax=Flavivirga aquimarina TaxID=2027862 RepID=A0ABT8WCV8_9FLAO|nr:hypothetical protein [Flavivirga aquimarina]MDO5970897.1 hypothetical protein [Flavivirga aquimarina]